MKRQERDGVSRRDLIKLSAFGAAVVGVAGRADRAQAADPPSPRSGPIGFTGFVHPTARIRTDSFSIGAASLIEGMVTLDGASARLGAASNLQDNDRLMDFSGPQGTARGDLSIGDGSFTAHGVTFVGRVRIGSACGTVINSVVQNARIGDASITGFLAQIRGADPGHPIEIPDASLVLFGARIRSQAEVAANVIPVPAAFSLFAADVDQENLLLARGYNLLFRAAARQLPFSAIDGDPRNPGAAFPTLATAFGKLAVAPPTVDRRGTGVIPARQASLGDLGFDLFPPLSPVPGPDTPDAASRPPANSPEAAARFIVPRVAAPELVSNGAVVLGGVELAAGVIVGAGSYLHGADSPTVSVGENTIIGNNTSLHELTFTSCRIGRRCVIGSRVVLHGPLDVGDDVTIGDRTVLFGPRIANGVRIGSNVLIFGPVDVTQDVPDNTIIVPPGQEGLVAPSAHAHGIGRPSRLMYAEWRRGGDAGGCGCGIGALSRV
jgi:carbonic anhydrase/acetyltransferase-like protein (isoleucine patch superfamily)